MLLKQREITNDEVNLGGVCGKWGVGVGGGGGYFVVLSGSLITGMKTEHHVGAAG